MEMYKDETGWWQPEFKSINYQGDKVSPRQSFFFHLEVKQPGVKRAPTNNRLNLVEQE